MTTWLLIFFVALFVLCMVWYLRVHEEKHERLHSYHLSRSDNNPILSPLGHNHWEALATFNPAAYLDDSGRVHMLYRAIGGDGQSRIGYANSSDGVSFGYRCLYPIFHMQSPRRPGMLAYDPIKFPSGGSWGGCEDPRLTRIEDHIYLTFNAFDDWDSIRIAVSTIAESDFIAQRWNWSEPLLISPDGVHKNWVLFPEKIQGKFAILHGLSPLRIDHVDHLEDLAHGRRVIKSSGNHGGAGYDDHTRKHAWDARVKGAGSPPIKTEKGWLVLYHALERHELHRYKVGALLLDLKDPTKIIARSPAPILSPDAWYENDWKPGIVYVCGAVVKDGKLLVYYGGGDKHVCVAETRLDTLLDWLVPVMHTKGTN